MIKTSLRYIKWSGFIVQLRQEVDIVLSYPR